MPEGAPLLPPPVQNPAVAAAEANNARPMADLRAEANGGTLPAPEFRFGDNRPRLGGTQFRLLPDRGAGGMGGAARPPSPGPAMASDPTGGAATQQSSAGFTPYFDEQVAGAPRRLGGRGRRPGARFTEGPMRGKTADQSKILLRSKYAGMSPEEKATYEGKARGADISSPVAAPKPAAVPDAAAPVLPPDPAADAAATPMGMEVGMDVAAVDKSFLKPKKMKRLLPGRQSEQMMA